MKSALKTIWETIKEHKLGIYGLEHLAVEIATLTDALLLGSVLIILFQLFIDANC